MKTPNIELAELAQSDSPAFRDLNDAFRALDAIVQLAVLSKSVSVPPTDAVQGDRYIVAAGATGDWVGHVKHVAYKTAAGWDFRTPRKGWVATVLDEENQNYMYSGLLWSVVVVLAANVSFVDASDSLTTVDAELLRVGMKLDALVLDDLLDVAISAPSSGDVLAFSGSLWVPATISGGGGSGNVTPDTHPTVPHAYDDEFEAGTLDAKWSWFNQGSSTAFFSQGSAVLTDGNTTADDFPGIEQTVSGNFKIRAKLLRAGQNFDFRSGLFLRNSGNGRILNFGIYRDAAGPLRFFSNTYSGVAAFNSSIFVGPDHWPGLNLEPGGHWWYFEMEYDGTTISLRISSSGVTGAFGLLGSTLAATYLSTPDRAGIFTDRGSSDSAQTVCDWFRGGF